MLLSVKPRFANLILAGTKRVEFRRSWATKEVSHIAIYSSSPVQKIVALAAVEEVVLASRRALLNHSTKYGGGLTPDELNDYFDGKERGYAVLLGKVTTFRDPVSPKSIISSFTPPQSFRYLTIGEAVSLGA